MPSVAQLRERYAGRSTPPPSSPDPHGVFWRHNSDGARDTGSSNSIPWRSTPLQRTSSTSSEQESPTATGLSHVVGHGDPGGPPQQRLQRSSSSEFVRERLDHYRRIASGSTPQAENQMSNLLMNEEQTEAPLEPISVPVIPSTGDTECSTSDYSDSSSSSEVHYSNGVPQDTSSQISTTSGSTRTSMFSPSRSHTGTDQLNHEQPPLIHETVPSSPSMFSPTRRPRPLRKTNLKGGDSDEQLTSVSRNDSTTTVSPHGQVVDNRDDVMNEPDAQTVGNKPHDSNHVHKRQRSRRDQHKVDYGEEFEDGIVTKGLKFIIPPIAFVPLTFLFRIFVVLPLRTCVYWVLGWYLHFRPRRKRGRRKSNTYFMRVVNGIAWFVQLLHNMFWGGVKRIGRWVRNIGSSIFSPLSFLGKVTRTIRRGIWLSVSITGRTIRFGLIQLGKEMKRAWRGVLSSPRTIYRASKLSWRGMKRFYHENREDVHDIFAAFTGLSVLGVIGVILIVPVLTISGVISYWDLQKLGLGAVFADIGLVERPIWIARAVFQG